MTKKAVLVIGVVFLLVGILGFFNDPVLGLFEVDLIHNLIHVLSGALAIVFAMVGDYAAKTYAKVLGVVYALVAVVGLFTSGDKILGLFEANFADDILHVVLALVILAVGFGDMDKMMASSGSSAPAPEPPKSPQPPQAE